MYDIVFCSVPYSNLDHIYSAPAILKGVAVSNGYTAKTKDFGAALFRQLEKNVDTLNKVQVYFLSQVDNEFGYQSEIDNFYQNCINFFRDNPSKYIAISVLSIFSHRAVFELCSLIKQSGIQSKIVLGGRGAKIVPYGNVSKHFELKGTEKLLQFGDFMLKRNFVDHVIIGDGEDAILELLSTDNVIKSDFVSESFRSSIPNYEDYDFSDYLFDNEIMLPVTGSKGCVRDCDFCDVGFQFGKYRYRTGSDIAEELIAVSQKFGIYKFQFTDSLVNGGLKPFREFLEKLSAYNLANKDKKITWNGQYICRPAKDIPASIYQLIKDSGGQGLTIGAESGSNRVLDAMNKKTTVEALFSELEYFRKHNITCTLLTFVGHWSETWDDFVEHCKMLIKLIPYVRSGTISAVTLGFPYGMLEGTPSMFNHKINNIVLDSSDPSHLWFNRTNPDNTFRERIYRRLIVQQICENFQIPTIQDSETLLFLIEYIKSSHNQINEFFKTVSRETIS